MNRLRRLISTIRDRFAARRESGMPGLEQLLEQAGVPRTISPELLEVAQLADLRLDGDGGDDGADDGGGDDDDGGGDDDDGDDDDDGGGDDDDDDDGDDDDDDDDDESEVQKQNRALKRQIAEERKKSRKAERAVKKAERKRLEKSGQHKRMYEEEKAEREELEGKLKTGSLDRAITAEATRQGFRSPDLASSIVIAGLNDAVDEDGDVDEDRVRDSLKKLAKREPGMVKKTKRQSDVTGDADDDDDGDDEDDRDSRRNGRRSKSDDDEKVSPRERLRRGHEKIDRDRKRAEKAGR
jgi:hypothetical protein